MFFTEDFISYIWDTRETASPKKPFTNLEGNPYWDEDFHFDVPSEPQPKSLGQSSIGILLLNTFVLFLFGHGKHNQQEYFINRSLKLLEKLPAEQNKIVTNFDSVGIKVNTAFDSQALPELKNNYRDHKKCLQCGVGNKILRTD